MPTPPFVVNSVVLVLLVGGVQWVAILESDFSPAPLASSFEASGGGSQLACARLLPVGWSLGVLRLPVGRVPRSPACKHPATIVD